MASFDARMFVRGTKKLDGDSVYNSTTVNVVGMAAKKKVVVMGKGTT